MKRNLLHNLRFHFLLTLVLLLGVIINTFGTTYYSRRSGNWNNTSTWSLSSGGNAGSAFPVAGDVAIIERNYTVTVGANAACASIQVGGNGYGILSFSASSNITLTVAGNVAVNSGCQITSSSNGSQTHTFNIGGNISCAGTWDMFGSGNVDDINVILNGTSQTISGGGTFGWNSLTVDSGSYTTVTSTQAQSVAVNLTIAGTLDFGTTTFNRTTAGGTLTVSGTMMLGNNTGGQSGSNFPTNFSTITLTSGTVIYDFVGAQTVFNRNYTNLTLSGSGTKTFSAATTINGDLSINSGVNANLGTFTSTANTLTLGGEGVKNGSWGSSSSTATYKNDSYFDVATGIINVSTSSCTPPTVSITGSNSICAGETTTLSPTTGGTWTSSNSGVASVTNGGVVTGVASGTATFTFTSSTTGCTNTTSAVTVNALPTVNAGGALTAICQGGTTAALGGSLGGGATSAVWSDGGAGGSFTNNGGTTPNTATYTASATSTSPVTLTLTSGGGSCGTATASKQLTVNQNPSIYSVTGGGSYCSGGSGVAIGLSGSETGVTYQLYNGASAVGSPVSGTGAAISFGNQAVAGTYTVVATRTSGGCTANMTGNATVTVISLSATISATNATTYCSSDGTATVTPSGGSGSYSYLWSPSGGSGATASGLSVGNYSVTVTDNTYGCTGTYVTSITTSFGSGCATPGKDGDITIPSAPNIYSTGVGSSLTLTAGSTQLEVSPGFASSISSGDLLLIIQMQGADMDISNTSTYGTTSNVTAGTYEYVAVQSVTSPLIGLKTTTPVRYNYANADATSTTPRKRYQIIKVPQYNNLTLGADIVVTPWDGNSGGIFAVDVAGTLTMAGHTINANGAGFRGGAGVSSTTAGGTPNFITDYVFPIGTAGQGFKGEGIAGTPASVFNGSSIVSTGSTYQTGDKGKGAPGNAGAGGNDATSANDQNSGGGGGANISSGGKGGNTWNSNLTNGGNGGNAFSGSATKVILGGGGGAGTANNGYISNGGVGGGIVFVHAGTIVNAGTITSNGVAGPDTGNDGAGGGGGGGSIVISATSGLNNITAMAIGGKGGNAYPLGVGAANNHGPGGGGSGGVIYATSALGSSTVTAGANGTTTTSAVPYGSSSGTAGSSSTVSESTLAAVTIFGRSCPAPDVTPPTVTCPTNITVCTGSVPTALTNFTDFNASDSGSGLSCIAYTETGSEASGTITRNYKIYDNAGNYSSCTHVITVNPTNTITLSSATGTDAQTTCINTAITNITYTTTGATGATFTGLPAGVTGAFASNTVTISGTPSVSGTFGYTVTLTGGCGTVTKAGSITVTPNNTITLSSAAGTDAQTTCINTAIANITYTTTGATGATFTGLPAGVNGGFASNTVTISGTPSVSGTFGYTVTLTGGCGTVAASGTITVFSGFTAGAILITGETICYNGNPGIIGSSSAASGGDGTITYKWQANGVDIASSNSATYDPPTGLTTTTTYTRWAKDNTCNTTFTQSTGSWVVTVTPNNTITLSSAVGTDAQTTCINTAITNITYTTTGATGATVTGLPAGVTGGFASNTVTISGTPTASGTFNYTVTLIGGCGTVTANGTLTVDQATVGGSVSGGTTICSGSTSGTLTLSGQTGTVTKWQSSVSPFSTWNDIANTSTTYTSGALTQTTQFRAVVQSGSCGSANSSATTVTVNQQSANPTSATASSSTICNGGSTTLTLNGGGGGTGEVIKWYSGSCGGTLVGTGNGLSVSPTTTTTYYGRFEDGAPCNYNSACSLVTVTVDPVSVGGTVSGGTTICSGSTSGTLTLSGQTGIVIKWQSSPDGTTWTDITNTSTTYTSGALTQTTQFRAVVQSGVCSLANSLATVVTVDPTSVGGTATPALSQVCYNSGTTITLSGYVGTIQWQTNASGSWADIPGETGNTYTTPNLITGTSYRARVTSGTCSTVYSNTVAITIDNVPPTFSGCPSPITQNVDAGVCSALVSWTVPTATDNCGGTPTVVRSSTSGVTFVDATHATVTVGTSTITYTATDAAGNQGTCSFTVTVTDNIAPTITCPAGATVFCVGNAPTYTTLTDFTNAGGTASDNCNLNASSFTKLPDNITGSTLTRTYQISDVAGNTSSCSQVFTISQPTVTISSLNTTNTCIGSTLSISSNSTGQNYQWQVSADNGSSWSPTGTNSPSYSGPLAHQGDQYRLLVSQTTDFSGAGCVSTSNVLTFREDTPPAFIIGTLGDQTVCTANGATSAAVYGISLTNTNVADNCTSFANLIKSYTLTGVLTGSGANLAEGTVFPLGATTVTYTVTDEAGKIATHSFTVTVNQSAPAITLSSAVVSGGGTGTAPHQCGDYNYFVTEDSSAPQAGYSYTWKIFTGSGTGGAQLSAGTDYLIDNSTSPYHAASVKISWEGSLMPGTYTIEVAKTGANGCDTKATLEISLQNSFNLTVNDPGQDCKGESLGTKIIDWQVSRTCGTNSYSFSYVIAAGQYTTMADAQAHAISGMPVAVSNTTNNPFIIYQTVDYGTGGDFYTTQIFTLFIYNQLDGNGQPDINAADDYQYFFLKAIPNTSAITTN